MINSHCLCKMCFPGKRLPMKRTHPENLFKEMLVQNVVSWTATANEKNPPRKSLRRNACAKCVFLGSGFQRKETTQQISSKKCAYSRVLKRRNDVVSYSLFILLPFSSLPLFAGVWGRDAAARYNEVPPVYFCSTTLIFLQASKIWVCTLYLFLIIHTSRQFILFYSPRALLLFLGLQLCILSPEGGVECSVLTASASWDSHSNEYFHNTECLL